MNNQLRIPEENPNDAAHERAYALNLSEVNATQERFEAREIEIEEFERAITMAEQNLALA